MAFYTSKNAIIGAIFDIHASHLQPNFGLLSITRNLNKWYNMIKTHLNNICSQIFEFTLTDIFLNAFSAKTSIQNRHLKTTFNQKKEARYKNNFEKMRKRALRSQLSGTFCKMGHPRVLYGSNLPYID